MRNFLSSVLRNRVSATGVALTTASALLFLGLVALDSLGYLENPYAGIVVFIMVPALFVFGLLLIPFGLWLERRRLGPAAPPPPSIHWSDPNVRRTAAFIAVATIINLAIFSFASFGAVEYSESQSFCGETCHPVMTPEFTAHSGGPHARVQCVECHVGPGPGAFLSAKLNGTRQLWLVATHSFRRPIPVPVHDLPPVAGTCEQCHWPDRYIGDVIKMSYEHADDAANTPTVTTLKLHVGGAVSGTGSGRGIHWHMNRANLVEYVALDEAREQIPYIRTTGTDGTVHEYFAEGVTPEAIAGKPRRRMDCTDCHNRAAHTYGSTPEHAVDQAIGQGLIDAKIPFIRREAVRALKVEYPSQEIAGVQIEQTIREALKANLPKGFEESALRRSIDVTKAIYLKNVFPAMNIKWGTYANQLGHTTSNGCFRCHDDTHKTRDGLTIKQDCESCHAIE